MAKTLITAVTPRGTFTRRSARPYRYVIVGRGWHEQQTRRWYAAVVHHQGEELEADVRHEAGKPFRALGWSQDRFNAEKAAAEHSKYHMDVELYEVQS